MGHVEYLLPDYLNDKLEESLRPGVERHLEGCASCRAELETLREGFQALRSHAVAEPSQVYFSTILPRVRRRLEQKKTRPFFAHPLIVRVALPVAAGALALVLLVQTPLPMQNAQSQRNPLQPVLQGVSSDELLEIVFEQQHHQMLHAVGEGETSALLAESLFADDRILIDSERQSLMEGPVLGGKAPEGLDQLSDSEIDVLVARLGERTIL